MSSVVLFLLIAAALVLAALGFILPALLQAKPPDPQTRSGVEAEIYRRTVDELQDEVARGELPPEEALAARDELRHRMAERTHASDPMTAPLPRARVVALFLAVALPLAAAALYFVVGMPRAVDAERAEAEASFEAPATAEKGDYIELLQKHLARQPRDARGWVLLARAQAELNDYRSAALSYEKALAVPRNKVEKDPVVLCEYADVLGMAQGGSLAGKPTELIRQALTIDPGHPVALEMAGSAAYADGRYADAVRHWKDLLERLTPGSERHQQLAAAIARAERRAAVALPR